MARTRYRCPICRVIFPAAGYKCRGSWPIYDPDRPNAVDEPHDEVEVELDPDADRPDP
jgi:rubredoxin